MYPNLETEFFHGHRYGIGVCWVVAEDLPTAKERVRVEMSAAGWTVADVFEVIEATVDTPRDEHERLSYERACEIGYYARIDLGRRRFVDNRGDAREGDVELPLQKLFIEYCLRIRAQGAAFLLTDGDNAYEMTHIFEQPTIPIWSSRKDAVAWSPVWNSSSRHVREVPMDDLLKLLEAIERASEEVGVSIGDILITFHPRAVAELVRSPASQLKQ